jgi:hypothetical protein
MNILLLIFLSKFVLEYMCTLLIEMKVVGPNDQWYG